MKEVTYFFHSPTAVQWQNISIQPHHGIVIPLFSIHSQQSHGIGEYTDLILLIDWCASIGFDIIQLLPINDTGLGKSPYGALSAFALDPIYLGLDQLPYLDEFPLLKEELRALPKFSGLSYVDYERVREGKIHFLRTYYRAVKDRILADDEYHHFLQQADWLDGYAAYKILKNRHQQASWELWPESEKTPTQELIQTIILEEKDEYEFISLLQFICDRQMKDAKEYAQNHRIFLMGDIPILIDRDSADVWLHQELFHLEYSAGAPPDMYSEDGQNWGFPTYRWNVLANQDYQWWKERLRWASRYFQIYRIDHIVGFFRIWSIPFGHPGKEGHYIPQDETTWIDHGQRIMLMMLNSCDMLPIGEDLGDVPTEVRSCLSALGICGTRVMRWERKWKEHGQYISPEDYPLDSMTTVSTHDSETLQQWWMNNPIEAQLFAQFKGWSYQPTLSRDHHREILWDSHHSTSLFHINLLQEYLALIPGGSWPDLNIERINIPGTISDQNWSYRLRLSLEELNQQESLKHLMQELIK